VLPIEKRIIPLSGNRTGRKLESREGVVIHYTANTGRGAGALGHESYVSRKSAIVNGKAYEVDNKGKPRLNAPFVYGAAHFYVDDKHIVQYLPKEEYAAHVGDKTTPAAIQKVIGGRGNYRLIGIELCVNPESDFKKALQNVCELAAYLLIEMGKGVDRLYRHADITGKNCPAMMYSEASWLSARKELSKLYNKLDPTWITYTPWSEVKATIAIELERLRNLAKIPPRPAKPVASPIPQGIRIFYEGQEIGFSDQKPWVYAGSTRGPMREVFDIIGWKTKQDPGTEDTFFTSPDGETVVTVQKDGKTYISQRTEIQVGIELKSNRLCGQYRALFEAIGFKVAQNPTLGGVEITK